MAPRAGCRCMNWPDPDHLQRHHRNHEATHRTAKVAPPVATIGPTSPTAHFQGAVECRVRCRCHPGCRGRSSWSWNGPRSSCPASGRCTRTALLDHPAQAHPSQPLRATGQPSSPHPRTLARRARSASWVAPAPATSITMESLVGIGCLAVVWVGTVGVVPVRTPPSLLSGYGPSRTVAMGRRWICDTHTSVATAS